MARPRIHDELMASVTFYLPKRLLEHPEHASRSELVYMLLENYQDEYKKRTGNSLSGGPKTRYNYDLKRKMENFFRSKDLRFFQEREDLDRFRRKYPETITDEFYYIGLKDDLNHLEDDNERD